MRELSEEGDAVLECVKQNGSVFLDFGQRKDLLLQHRSEGHNPVAVSGNAIINSVILVGVGRCDVLDGIVFHCHG